MQNDDIPAVEAQRSDELSKRGESGLIAGAALVAFNVSVLEAVQVFHIPADHAQYATMKLFICLREKRRRSPRRSEPET